MSRSDTSRRRTKRPCCDVLPECSRCGSAPDPADHDPGRLWLSHRGFRAGERKERVDTGTPHLPQAGTGLEEFFDLTIDLLCIVGFDGYFKRVDPSLERTLGYPRSELVSRSVLDVTHPDDVQPSREALAQFTEGHDLVGFESRVSCAGAVW